MLSLLCRIFAFIVLLLVGFHIIHSDADIIWPWIALSALALSFVVDDLGPPVR